MPFNASSSGLASASREALRSQRSPHHPRYDSRRHLGAYGFQSISTPNIDWLARDGVLFLQTSAVAPLTMPAHASLYTGRFPFGHGVRDNADFVLDPRETTLAEVLQQRGYQTGAFVSSVVLAASRGLNQGFDSYRDDFTSVPCRASTACR